MWLHFNPLTNLKPAKYMKNFLTILIFVTFGYNMCNSIWVAYLKDIVLLKCFSNMYKQKRVPIIRYYLYIIMVFRIVLTIHYYKYHSHCFLVKHIETCLHSSTFHLYYSFVLVLVLLFQTELIRFMNHS